MTRLELVVVPEGIRGVREGLLGVLHIVACLEGGLDLVSVHGGDLHVVASLEGSLDLVSVRGGDLHVVAGLEGGLDLGGVLHIVAGLEGDLDLFVVLEGGLEGGPEGGVSCWWLIGPAGTDLLSS